MVRKRICAVALAALPMAATTDARTLQPELRQALESIAAQADGRVGAWGRVPKTRGR